MDTEWHIRQQLEISCAPTSVQYHRIDTYSSIVEGVKRVRRVLSGDPEKVRDKFIQACGRNDIETVNWLFENSEPGSINLRRGINRSALHEAALHHDGQSLARLLCQHGADPTQRDSLGRTAIHYAASCGHMDVMLELIHFLNAPISSLTDMEGRCPLMYACGEGHLSLCRWLIEYTDADFQRQDDRGRSCLIYACRGGHTQLVEWLLLILSPESTFTGWHPLHYACSSGYLDIVKILLQYTEQGGHVLTNTGHSALFMAMHSSINNKEMVECLLDSHPSVQLTTQDIHDLNCDKSLLFLLAQRRHSITYLFEFLERINYFLPFIHLLLLSEHIYCRQRLLSIPYHQSFIRHRLQNPMKLKQIMRCFIRKSIDKSNKIDLLEINQYLKKFIRFEYL
ncbi:unnamed protein product [Adineta steineri]|uniref:Uncharacterized protein n=1 Tax=Adineta steineri TaxID=433720 RepID=A0A814L9V0_9BILA|nr:unnamed protein product [Adineta steineri]CAF1060515.1 unnamed protein product [Adineta steineri]CAF1107535.1 unnamed protein product [Adineta steineri]CAF3852792.1 unnamed protein product [Adineta steineri]